MVEKFYEWRQKESLKQIRYISILTAFVYLLLGLTNNIIAPGSIHFYIVNYQLFIISSYLFFISYLAFKSKNFFRIELLLFLGPIFAASIHTSIVSNLDSYSSYQTELYLMIFWIYTISGMRLFHAILSSSFVLIIGILGPYLFYPEQYHDFLQHTTWMIISFAFGLIGGYLMQASQKSTFIKELQLKELASKDTLTGLSNRFELDETLALELSRAQRYQQPIGLMIIDLDFFKKINDNFGHLEGDKVLIQVAQVLRDNIRNTDLIYRWGGEEFIVLCLEVNKDNTSILGEHIRHTIQNTVFDTIGSITLSIGATVSTDTDDIASLIKRADKALYLAKDEGRNCIKLL